MNIGAMNRKIVIQSPPTEKDAGGELSGDWVDVSNPWASVRDESNSESPDDGSIVSMNIKSFIIHFRSNITHEMRILFDGIYYQISGIAEIRDKDSLRLTAYAKSNW